MKRKTYWLAFTALYAAVLTAGYLERESAQAITPGEVPYQTGCQAVDANTVEGFVTNPGVNLLQVNGMVRFTFTVANSMSRPTVQLSASALIPPGRTMSVARTRLVWSLMPSELCAFDVSGAVR